MADEISTITIDGVTYDIADKTARENTPTLVKEYINENADQLFQFEPIGEDAIKKLFTD